MPMTFAAMVSAMNATNDSDRKFAILIDFLRDNTIEGALDVVNAIPTADQDDSATVWNDAGVLKVSTAP